MVAVGLAYQCQADGVAGDRVDGEADVAADGLIEGSVRVFVVGGEVALGFGDDLGGHVVDDRGEQLGLVAHEVVHRGPGTAAGLGYRCDGGGLIARVGDEGAGRVEHGPALHLDGLAAGAAGGSGHGG